MPIRGVIGTTVVRIRILIGTTVVRIASALFFTFIFGEVMKKLYRVLTFFFYLLSFLVYILGAIRSVPGIGGGGRGALAGQLCTNV